MWKQTVAWIESNWITQKFQEERKTYSVDCVHYRFTHISKASENGRREWKIGNSGDNLKTFVKDNNKMRKLFVIVKTFWSILV